MEWLRAARGLRGAARPAAHRHSGRRETFRADAADADAQTHRAQADSDTTRTVQRGIVVVGAA
jgi:hypothetical protein